MRYRETNPITQGYPDHVEVNGKRKAIRTGFRYWIQIALCIEDGAVDDVETVYSILELSQIEPTDLESDLNALVGFLSGGGTSRGKAGKVLDYQQDAALIVASFQHWYGIDLTDPKVNMHWWRFLDLLSGLGEDTPIMRAVKVRTAELPKGNDEATRERRKALEEAKRAYRLVPRNAEQAAARDREIWG